MFMTSSHFSKRFRPIRPHRNRMRYLPTSDNRLRTKRGNSSLVVQGQPALECDTPALADREYPACCCSDRQAQWKPCRMAESVCERKAPWAKEKAHIRYSGSCSIAWNYTSYTPLRPGCVLDGIPFGGSDSYQVENDLVEGSGHCAECHSGRNFLGSINP